MYNLLLARSALYYVDFIFRGEMASMCSLFLTSCFLIEVALICVLPVLNQNHIHLHPHISCVDSSIPSVRCNPSSTTWLHGVAGPERLPQRVLIVHINADRGNKTTNRLTQLCAFITRSAQIVSSMLCIAIFCAHKESNLLIVFISRAMAKQWLKLIPVT